MNLISTEKIQSTFTYIQLGKIDPKHPGLNNKMQQQMLLKRASRELLTHQLILHRNGKPIEPVLNRYQLAVLNELIEAEKDEKSKSENQ